MPGGLPPVLLTNTDTITEEIDNPDQVQIEDVAKLWKVYHLNSTHMQDDEGARLENFFWRIWSNKTINQSIRGNTLARQFIDISEGGNRVRTTPVPTPFGSPPFRRTAPPNGPFLGPSSDRDSPDDDGQDSAIASSAEVSGSSLMTSKPSKSLAPILKKGRQSSDNPPRSVRKSSTEKRESNKSGLRKSSESDETLSPSLEKGLKNQGKKKTSFASASGPKKVRPGPTRKKSYQSSTSGEQRKTSQSSLSPRLPNTKISTKPTLGLPPLSNPTFALPSSSWQDVDSPSSSLPSHEISQPASWLVDKNFRGKFVEHQARAFSSTNLTGLGKSQSVRFLDELPENKQAGSRNRNSMRSADIEKEESDLAEPSAIGSQKGPDKGSDEDENEDDEDDEDEDDMPALPRTKSQLSMLIEKERKMSGSANLTPDPSRQENRRRRALKVEDDDDEDNTENELLTMGRSDKKGKGKAAVDPDHPFKEAARKGLLRAGKKTERSEGSRSPPPLF